MTRKEWAKYVLQNIQMIIIVGVLCAIFLDGWTAVHCTVLSVILVNTAWLIDKLKKSEAEEETPNGASVEERS